jgi:hypothetical protein
MAEKILGRILPDAARFLKEIPWPAVGAPPRGYSSPGVERGTMLAVKVSLVNIYLISLDADKTVSGPVQSRRKITSQSQLFVAYLGTESRVM